MENQENKGCDKDCFCFHVSFIYCEIRSALLRNPVRDLINTADGSPLAVYAIAFPATPVIGVAFNCDGVLVAPFVYKTCMSDPLITVIIDTKDIATTRLGHFTISFYQAAAAFPDDAFGGKEGR